jgi:integrase/recombinase XerD
LRRNGSPNCHPVGTKARLALALLLYTSWRREDAPRLGPQHIYEAKLPDGSTEKRIKYRQAKNENRNPVDMDIRLQPDLAAIIDATPSGHLTFLITEYGKSFTANGFGNRFKDWCRQANLPHCSAHGLRSATAIRLAERGATPHEIMAITGHQTLEEVEHYTRAAGKRRLADSAMDKLKSRT